jgi:hypothetical protein
MSGGLPRMPLRQLVLPNQKNSKRIVITRPEWEKIRRIWAKTKPKIQTNSSVTSERILEIISNARYRKGRRSHIEYEKFKECFLNAVNRCVTKGKPIEIIIPSFTFKFTHPLKTNSTRADMAEAASLSKLHELCDQIKSIYPKGATIYIARDGRLYSDIFGRSTAAADKYGADLQTMINRLGYSNEIKILDIKTALEKQPDYLAAYSRAFQEVKDVILNPGEKTGEISALYGSAAANLETGNIPTNMVERIFSLPKNQLIPDEIIAKAHIEGRAKKAVQEYLTRNRTIEILDLYSRMRPDAVRGSVHIGAGKLPLQLNRQKTQLFPWMGVAVLDGRGATVRYEGELRDNPQYIPVYLKGQKAPFYYLDKSLL